MITITGLTTKQKLLLDVMWELDSLDKVKAFIATLPVQDARDAHSLLQVAIWETIEAEDGLDAYTDQARSIISSVSK